VAVGAIVSGLLVWSTPALAQRAHVFSSSFGSAGSGSGQFSGPTGVAVDEATGDVYVDDRGNGRVEKFSAAGAFQSEFPVPSTSEGPAINNSIAVDNSPTSPSRGDVYVIDSAHSVIDKFDASGAPLTTITSTTEGPLGLLDGVTVDAAGRVWAYQENSKIYDFSSAGANEFIAARESPFGASPGFAVDSEDDLYVNRGATVFAKLNSSGGSLIEELGAEGAVAATVDLVTNDVYINNVSTVGAFTAAGAPIERFGAHVLEQGSGVAINSGTGNVYVADSAAEKVDVFIPEPPAAPAVEDESASHVTSTGATLEARINPHGAGTTYRFEYGPTEAYGTNVPIPDGDIGSGFSVVTVSVHADLPVPGTTYHYRVTAVNVHGAVPGPDRTLTSRLPGAFSLPDGRAWELVSPPDKHGATLESLPFEGGLIQASEDGRSLTYLSRAPTEAIVEGNAHELMQLLATRAAAGGWSTRDIATHDEAANGENSGEGNEYRFFSSDLSLALVEQVGFDETPLSPEATERTMYRRDNTTGGYLPLVTTANVPPGTKFGIPPESHSFLSATPDLTHVIFKSKVALTPTPITGESLYEWAAGRLQLISVLPDGTPAHPALLGENGKDVRHAISDDGTRVFWEDGENRHLYLRDVAKQETLQLDSAQGVPEPPGEAVFQTASVDGSKVFFTDGQGLTADSTASGEENRDLYECEIVEVAGKLACELHDLTVDHNSGESAAVQGLVLGASEDGAYVYFVANGALAGSATPGDCARFTNTAGATCNLYVWHEGSLRFVATLSNEDRPVWLGEGGFLGRVASRVAPHGLYLAFMSDRSLTGYNSTDVSSGQADEEVYLYDARADRLVCASCNPTGARPTGVLDTGGMLVDRRGVWTGHWLAASIPGWTPIDLRHALYQSRYLSDSGRLFFNSPDVLVPQATNGKEDVYEYEPQAVGLCTNSSATFNASSGGCVGLISSGTAAEESAFLDASAGGEDAFFLSASRLVPEDMDDSFDVYDAHVCTASEPCPTQPEGQPAECGTAEACRGAPSPQPTVLGTPGSSLLSGNGNLMPLPAPATKTTSRAQRLAKALKACARKPRRKRAACKRQARRRYGSSTARKGSAKTRPRASRNEGNQ
jgi:hypothetical protein